MKTLLLLLLFCTNALQASDPQQAEDPELIAAITRKDVNNVQMLIAAGADVECTDKYGCTSLVHAITGGNAAIVEMLIAAGADTDTAKYGIWMAVVEGNVEIASTLIAGGAAIDDFPDCNPLWQAIWHKNLLLIKKLLYAGASLSTLDANTLEFLKHQLTEQCDLELVAKALDDPYYQERVKEYHRGCIQRYRQLKKESQLSGTSIIKALCHRELNGSMRYRSHQQ